MKSLNRIMVAVLLLFVFLSILFVCFGHGAGNENFGLLYYTPHKNVQRFFLSLALVPL